MAMAALRMPRGPRLQESLKRVFAKEGEEGFIGIGSNAHVEVHVSKDIKVHLFAWLA
jgi:hypothetical protein